MIPKVGLPVYYTSLDATDCDREPLHAVIVAVRVHARQVDGEKYERCRDVSLQISHPSGLSWRHGVEYHPEAKPGCWRWPE